MLPTGLATSCPPPPALRAGRRPVRHGAVAVAGEAELHQAEGAARRGGRGGRCAGDWRGLQGRALACAGGCRGLSGGWSVSSRSAAGLIRPVGALQMADFIEGALLAEQVSSVKQVGVPPRRSGCMAAAWQLPGLPACNGSARLLWGGGLLVRLVARGSTWGLPRQPSPGSSARLAAAQGMECAAAADLVRNHAGSPPPPRGCRLPHRRWPSLCPSCAAWARAWACTSSTRSWPRWRRRRVHERACVGACWALGGAARIAPQPTQQWR